MIFSRGLTSSIKRQRVRALSASRKAGGLAAQELGRRVLNMVKIWYRETGPPQRAGCPLCHRDEAAPPSPGISQGRRGTRASLARALGPASEEGCGRADRPSSADAL